MRPLLLALAALAALILAACQTAEDRYWRDLSKTVRDVQFRGGAE